MSGSLNPTITESQRATIAEIRRRFGDDLPPDLNTDFNLRRWAYGWRGKMKEIEPRLRSYIVNRRAAKLDSPDLLDTFRTDEYYCRLFKYFSMSLNTSRVDPTNNTLVFVYRSEGVHWNQIAKVMTAKEFTTLNFLGSEIMLRAVLRHEALSGRPSGVTILYDAGHIRLSDFINPASPIMQYAILGINLQQDYYCELLQRLLVFQAPTFADVLWDISKRFLHPDTRRKATILRKEDGGIGRLLKYANRQVVPVAYGGEWMESLGDQGDLNIDPPTCCTVPLKTNEKAFYKPSWHPPDSQWLVESIRPKQTFTIGCKVSALSSTIKWQFRVSEKVVFGVSLKANEDGPLVPVHPKLTLCTPFLPETDQLICAEYGLGTYLFTFMNESTAVMSLKLEYAIVRVN